MIAAIILISGIWHLIPLTPLLLVVGWRNTLSRYWERQLGSVDRFILWLMALSFVLVCAVTIVVNAQREQASSSNYRLDLTSITFIFTEHPVWFAVGLLLTCSVLLFPIHTTWQRLGFLCLNVAAFVLWGAAILQFLSVDRTGLRELQYTMSNRFSFGLPNLSISLAFAIVSLRVIKSPRSLKRATCIAAAVAISFGVLASFLLSAMVD
jgi:hypothetical protein